MKNTNIRSEIPSHETLLRYKRNELSAAEINKFKDLLNENEFYSEALEGYNRNAPELFEIDELKNAINIKIHKSNFNYFISVLILSVTCYFSLFGFVRSGNEKAEVKSPAVTYNTAPSFPSAENSLIAAVVDSNIILDDNYVVEKTNEPNEIVDRKKVVSGVEIIKPIYSKNIDHAEIEKGLSPVSNNSNVPVKYINNILVVDYLKMKGKKMTVQNKIISVPAYSEIEKYLDDGTTRIKINLNDLLKNGINEFEKEKYVNAIKSLNELEEFFPNDLNVIFYKAMSYYKMNKYKDALPFFNRAIEHDFNTFQQDALWFKAKALIEMGNKAEAKIIIEKIIESNSYYTAEAKKLMKDLNE